ncbi:MAG: outer membrane protein assembly factor BamA [Pseudomonadota bacterium]
MVLFIGLAAPAPAQTFQVNNFEIEGNARITSETILTVTGIAPGSTVTAGEVNDALQRLQNSGLFESVEVEPRGNTLRILVREFPTINRISIEGNDNLDDDALLPLIESTPRRVYSPIQAERDAEAIAEAYRIAGRFGATVTPQIIRRSDNRVDLVFDITESRVVETERIAFVGNRAFSDRRLRRVLESTQAGLFRLVITRDTFIEERIELDRTLLIDFYRDRGYVDFEILSVTSELARDRGAFFVTFNVQEGQQFSVGEVTTVSDLPEINVEEYQNAIRLRSGAIYSPRLVDNAISRMEALSTQQGLRFIRIEPRITRNEADLTLDVEFVISRGERVFVQRIDIEGNSTTLDRVIRRQFDTVEGDPFDPRAIRAASERIRATGFFSDVQVASREGATDDQVIVDVDVVEQPTGSLGFSASFSTDAGPGLAVTFAEQNFLGRGQSVDFGFNTTEGSQSYTFSFNEPAFLRRDLNFGVGLFFQETDSQNRDFDTRDVGGNFSIGFPISEFGRLRLRYGIESNEISGLSSDTSPIIIADEGERLKSFVGIGYAFDTRDRGLDPTAGIRLQFDVELAGLGGEAEYVRATALAIAEQSILQEEVTLRASFEAGGLSTFNGDSQFQDRFFLSSRQMRGFEPFGLGPRDVAAPDEDALGGEFFAVARFEAAFPLGLPDEYGLSGGVFADFGSVWSLDNTAGFGGFEVDDGFDLRGTIGISIFWATAIGPLRFNFSQPLLTEDFDLTREFELTVEARF